MRKFLDYRVVDFMSTEPTVIGPETLVAAAERLFESHDFNALPVVDDSNRLLGLLTKLDLLRAFTFTPDSMIPDYEAIMELPAERVMSLRPISVPPDTPLTRVLQRLVDTRSKSFPVVADGRLIGMIAREDILRAVRTAASSDT